MAAEQRWVTQQLDIDQKEVILIQDKIIRAGKEKISLLKNRQQTKIGSKIKRKHQDTPRSTKDMEKTVKYIREEQKKSF